MSEIAASPVILTDENFEAEVIRSDVPVLVDFWAEWCGPCKALAPTLDNLAVDYAGKFKIAKLDIEEFPTQMGAYNVRAFPTLIFFNEGVEFTRFAGVQSRSTFEGVMNEILSGADAEETSAKALEDPAVRGAFFRDASVSELETLLDDKPDYVNEPLAGGASPMHALLGIGDREKIEALRSRGACFGVIEYAYFGMIEELKAMLDEDPALINVRDSSAGMPALYHAILKGRYDCAKLLLDRGADANASSDQFDISLLSVAVQYADMRFVELLLEFGADPLVKTARGDTLFHLAFYRGDPPRDLLELLLSSGVDPHAENEAGRTPIEAVRANLEMVIEQAPDRAEQTRLRVKNLEDLWSAVVVRQSGRKPE